MGKFIDLTGQKFGRLTVIERVEDYISPSGYKKIRWLCQCECGNTTAVEASSLRTGHVKSCGCIVNNKNGLYKTTLYKKLKGMKERCYRKYNDSYKNYGARGIKICDEWLDKNNGFLNFYNWAINNGYKDGLSIDRINVNGNYEPNNCRWVSMSEQSKNTRNTHNIMYQGETHCLSDWAKISGIKRPTLLQRINNGWSIEKALTTPTKQKVKHV